MSNKSQLQTNNTKVASLIEVLKTKGTPSGEEVTEETNAYTVKLETLETAITALENELEGKASGGSGGSNTAGEWVPFSSLPQTFAPAEPETTSSIFYYEIPTNCVSVVVRLGTAYRISYKEYGTSYSPVAIGSLMVTDADNTGTVLCINVPNDVISAGYLLPIYAPPSL